MVGSKVLISSKKEPLKINGVFKLYLKAVSNSTDWHMSTISRHLFFFWIDWPTSQETNMAEYMERNVTLIRNLIEDNKTYKHVSEILRQNFPEVTRGFSERNVRLFCAKYGIRRLNEFEVDSIVQDCVKEVSLFLFLQFVWIGTFHFYSCLPLWMSKFLPPHFFVGKKLFLSHQFLSVPLKTDS